MSRLLDHVDDSIRSRGLFLPGQRILVAVSGGVDSMVLLHVLGALGKRHRWRLMVAHLNHQLRGRSSDADERLVRRAAQKLKLPLVVGRVAVRELAAKRKVSIEMAAREARHDFLARNARQRRIPVIALAHHVDDQVELFFLRLLRGSGSEGLAGMKWRAPSPGYSKLQIIRPLLDVPKSELLQYAKENRIAYREDASNASVRFQRNRIRNELLPLLRRHYQPALDGTILRVMQILGDESDFAQETARAWLGSVGGAASHPAYEELPVSVQRAALRLQLIRMGVVPDFEMVERLRLEAETAVSVPASAGHVLREKGGVVRLTAVDGGGFSSDELAVDLKSKGEVLFGGTRVSWQIRRMGKGSEAVAKVRPSPGMEVFDADKVGGSIYLRHWRPGDRFQPIGMNGSVKLQDLFTNLKVPRDLRPRLIVANASNGEIFWVEGLRISERFKLTQDTNRRLQWRWKRV